MFVTITVWSTFDFGTMRLLVPRDNDDDEPASVKKYAGTIAGEAELCPYEAHDILGGLKMCVRQNRSARSTKLRNERIYRKRRHAHDMNIRCSRILEYSYGQH